ncbi:transglycosylase SLT domain-containing protein [Reichenbachiella agarivorans]|uniref:Transglycosylase SLT domain-containing protein n=1 Tax=Reichenbachiella agarivorans TaxID=2979464 RepID=A0ABY6CUZ2_9BACT|nr:lytic transglycosylase domain-containing protein [Reichenbachiella agarivorans]UXP33263.1 transglycosylase SLT domain-containing protein [Reichenbachiella agarivorans]
MRDQFYILLFCLVTVLQPALAQESDVEQWPDYSYELVEDRLSCVEEHIPLVFNERVYSFIDYFAVRNRDYTRAILAKKDLYFPIFEQVLAEKGLPDELKYLAIIESGLNPNAMSRVGAGGLWQFMPLTGKSYKLKQSWYIDERMNPWEATEAAASYLGSLYRMFGDWELALAAYNTGPGNVRKAIRRSGYKETFWDIYNYLPRETRSYVPQLVAMIYVIKYADEHNLQDLNSEKRYMMAHDTVHVSDYIHMETLANQLDVCLEDLLTLNPQIIRGAIPEGTSNYALKVPLDKADSLRIHKVAMLDSAGKVGKAELEYVARNTPGSVYGRVKQVYRVRGGDVLGTIAENHHVSVADLKAWNNLSSNMIRVGQNLNIWVTPYYTADTKSSYVAKTNTTSQSAPVQVEGGKYHLVQSGDSLWSIAQQYKDLSIEKIKKLNNLTSSNIKPGQKLLINM